MIRGTKPRGNDVRLLLIAAFLVPSATVADVPRARSGEECAVFADLMLVASAMRKADVPRVKADAAIADIYEMREHAGTIARHIVDLAYSRTHVPKDVAVTLGTTCLRNGGDMNSLFGTGT